jgi:drug/metabolite transporter (DMT)-like permease
VKSDRPLPSLLTLLAAAGIAWGVYSLGGRLAGDPLAATTGNFGRSVPLAAVLLLVGRHPELGVSGLLLAVFSGAVASASGYVAWYAAVRRMTASRAAIIQLAIPVLAALGGVAFLGEAVSPRLVIATVTVLGGISLTMGIRAHPSRDRR